VALLVIRVTRRGGIGWRDARRPRQWAGKGKSMWESGSREEVELSSRLPLPPFLSRLIKNQRENPNFEVLPWPTLPGLRDSAPFPSVKRVYTITYKPKDQKLDESEIRTRAPEDQITVVNSQCRAEDALVLSLAP
jgi:hypothetical protein